MTITHQLSSLLSADAAGHSSDIHICAWCRRCYLPNGQFVERPFLMVNVSHGACPICFHKQLQAARQTAKKVAR
jgi:hypothetical protein